LALCFSNSFLRTLEHFCKLLHCNLRIFGGGLDVASWRRAHVGVRQNRLDSRKDRSKSGKYLVAITGEISLLGCFVKTATPFPSIEPVNLKIASAGEVFNVQGAVVYVLPAKGMGIKFSAISPGNQAIL
jgi:hypothetical protein